MTRFPALDFLRFVAALVVALRHNTYGGVHIPPQAAALAIGFFFILSGFVLRHAYGEEIASRRMPLQGFFAVRIARLYPLHLLTLLLMATYWVRWDSVALSSELLFLQGIIPTNLNYNPPAWTIGIEFWGSFVIFGLCLLRSRAQQFTVAAVILLAFIAVEIEGGFLDFSYGWFLGLNKNYILGFGCFVLGWLAYGWQPKLPAALVWTGAAILFVVPLATAEGSLVGTCVELAYFVAFAGLIAALAQLQVHSSIARIMDALGALSYGVYMWHIPVLLFLTLNATGLERQLGIPLFGYWHLEAVYIPTVLVIAAVGYRLFELPAKRAIRVALQPRRNVEHGTIAR